MDQGELEGMPEPAVLRLHTSDGQVLVTWGRDRLTSSPCTCSGLPDPEEWPAGR